MNKRKLFIVIGIIIVCIFVGILSFAFQKQKKVDQAIKMYQEFIEGERTASGWDIKTLSTPTGEPERRVETAYTMVDVNGDGLNLYVYYVNNPLIRFEWEKGELEGICIACNRETNY